MLAQAHEGLLGQLLGQAGVAHVQGERPHQPRSLLADEGLQRHIDLSHLTPFLGQREPAVKQSSAPAGDEVHFRPPCGVRGGACPMTGTQPGRLILGELSCRVAPFLRLRPPG
ncbi:MAG TPA: hypothetical protein VGR26_09595 [Acidimicrobiales bacterium]|nr:hypothetical protein [Acidimicrobiales bacterium]